MYARSITYPGHCLINAMLIVLFGLFLHQSRWLAFICLAAALFLFSQWIWKESSGEVRQVLGFNKCRVYWMVYGAILGIGLAMFLRWNQTRTLYPWSPRPFLVIAIMVGLTEELLFRGYFFGRLSQWNGVTAAVVISALLHTAYKVAIFIPSDQGGDLLFLGSVTFGAGLILGHWRKASRSIWPCIVFHALFDLWVYGDRSTPWWVW